MLPDSGYQPLRSAWEANCGQESYHPSYVGGCGGNRIDRLLIEAGDGINRTAPATGRCADAAARTLCGPACSGAEVRLKETAGAQGAAPCATAREKDDDHHHNDDSGGDNPSAEPVITAVLQRAP